MGFKTQLTGNFSLSEPSLNPAVKNAIYSRDSAKLIPRIVFPGSKLSRKQLLESLKAALKADVVR